MNGSLPGSVTADCEIDGDRKLDGPGYMTGLISSIYQEIFEVQAEDIATRVNIIGMYSGNRFHNYHCTVAIKAIINGEEKTVHDELWVYVDRDMTKLE